MHKVLKVLLRFSYNLIYWNPFRPIKFWGVTIIFEPTHQSLCFFPSSSLTVVREGEPLSRYNRELKQRRLERERERERLKRQQFRLAKQQLCITCITLFFLTFLCRQHDYNVTVPNFTFFLLRGHKTTTFFFLSWTLLQSFRIQLQKIYPHMTN